MTKAQLSRHEFSRGTLRSSDLSTSPLDQFQKWFEEAKSKHAGDPSAVALATADGNGAPSIRMVLLKDFGAEGFIFATSYGGRKARDLAENPHASLLFFWEDLERQIRIEGVIERTSEEVSDRLFNERPLASQIAAVTSRQSEPIVSRSELETAYQANVEKYRYEKPHRPETWGGYSLKPASFEFWQGGVHRLHDRFEYRLNDSQWTARRLQP